MRTPWAALALSLIAVAAQAQSTGSGGFSIRQDQASIGTNIRKTLVHGSGLPFDKTYAELTAEQKQLLHSQYEKMGPRDEPPFPVNGLRTIYGAIAQAQQTLLARGPLTLFVDVDSSGNAVSVSVLESPDPDMTKAAASILMLQKYKPALCDGAPCRMQFPLRMTLVREL